MSLKNWSTTAASNATVDSINFAEGQAPSSLNDSARALMADVRSAIYTKGSDIASATTTDLAAASTEGLFHDITGTTTITGLGTVGAGVWKVIKFEGVLTLTHNATSLILPGAENITTADGDVGIFVSEGSGNWRCVSYQLASQPPKYAVGTWTPTIISSGGGAPTYTTQTGRYIKIGKKVFASAVIDLATAGTLAAGTLTVGGFPFTVQNSVAARATATCSWASFSTSFINVLIRMAENTTTAELLGATAAVSGNSAVSQANFGATGGIRFGITYEASA